MRTSSIGEVKGRCRFRFICYPRDQAVADGAKATTDVHRSVRFLEISKKNRRNSFAFKARETQTGTQISGFMPVAVVRVGCFVAAG
jgi:hypothetical protein